LYPRESRIMSEMEDPSIFASSHNLLCMDGGSLTAQVTSLFSLPKPLLLVAVGFAAFTFLVFMLNHFLLFRVWCISNVIQLP